ncbi:MAG: glycosyltransferase [Ignavibacteria bacterium]|nr:glycosyltransferase [Ignavibacteria bacterium]
MSYLLAYNLVIAAITIALALVSIYNLRRFARMPSSKGLSVAPDETLVSILVPARNEERCIEACVRSLCEQDHKNTEVIVLNDASTDATGEILSRLTGEFPHLRVIEGAPLPNGWVGKSWACLQLSKQARGETLIFTDADTTHRPDMVRRARAYMTQNNIALFSLVPYQVLGSIGEHIVIPMVHVLYFAYLPNDLILQNKRVSLSAANGQFMCFTRDAYEKVGGHESVRSTLVEDVFLAKEVKRAGLRIALVDGTDAVECRMYTNAREVTEGFSKNFFPATNYNLPLTVLFLVHVLTTYVLPLPMAVYGFVIGDDRIMGLALLQLGLGALIRLLISKRFSMPWWHMFLQPLTGLWSTIIGVNSIRWAYSRTGSRWKGRSYDTKGQSHA